MYNIKYVVPNSLVDDFQEKTEAEPTSKMQCVSNIPHGMEKSYTVLVN
jgi:hypothetical protein